MIQSCTYCRETSLTGQPGYVASVNAGTRTTAPLGGKKWLTYWTTGFTMRFRRKRYVSFRVFAENEKFRFFSEYAIYCRKRTVLLRVFANTN
jgi:hypothetical protein